ncbi:hypothetical protein LguiA_004252 [Lonicera macranthoides]
MCNNLVLWAACYMCIGAIAEDYHFMVEEEEDKENKEEEFDFPGTETNRENKQIDLEEFNEFVNTTENVFEQEENKGLMSQG